MPLRKLARLAQHPVIGWIVPAILAAALILAGVVFYQNVDQGARDRRYSQCVARWADAYTARAELITGANGKMLARMDAVMRAVKARSQARFDAALRDYLAASDRLQKASAAHPIPPPPRFACK